MSDDKKPSNPDVFPIGHKHGLSLRDLFACHIMAAMHSNANLDPHKTPEELAQLAYERADALLRAREAP